MKPRLQWLILVALVLLFPGATHAQAPVKVLLWFDTEDYLLPADDDACKRLAILLTERRVRATFKVVGEKARVLESRGRHDVIRALKKHDIAYHANLHSVHPTPTEYLADCSLAEGMAEFVRREGGGAEDVRRIFSVGTLGCYGQPGSSWAPQAIAALDLIHVSPHRVPCYVDEGEHVGLDQKPFWYMGALTVYHMGENCTRMELHDPAAVEPAKQKVSEIVARLGREGGGLVSIYYHPCEWVHQQFWDGVNFSRGANPPREHWKRPPQRPPEETAAAFLRFEQYIDHIRSLPGIQFVTASDLPLLCPDKVRQADTSLSEVAELASRLVAPESRGLNYQVIGSSAYSVADQFELLALAVGNLICPEKSQAHFRAKGLLGPDAAPPPGRQAHLEWPAFRDATIDVVSFVRSRGAVPARVFVGPETYPPGDFLVSLAQVWMSHQRSGTLPTSAGVSITAGSALLPASHIAEDTPGLFGGWIIHKENFRAPKLMEMARLQAWTLKPAVPKSARESTPAQ